MEMMRFKFLGVRGEFTPLSGAFGVSLNLGAHDEAICVGLRVILFSLYLSGGGWKLANWLQQTTKRSDDKYGNGRSLSIYWFEDGLWWQLWADPMSSHSKDPWYVKTHVIRPLDILLGRPVYSSRNIETVRGVVPMPEGGYPATIELNEDSWKRARWPWPKKLRRADVTPDTPIPFPGKGENAWDCGEDATHSIYCCADTPLKAVIALSESVMKSRLRYGGGWEYKPVAK